MSRSHLRLTLATPAQNDEDARLLATDRVRVPGQPDKTPLLNSGRRRVPASTPRTITTMGASRRPAGLRSLATKYVVVARVTAFETEPSSAARANGDGTANRSQLCPLLLAMACGSARGKDLEDILVQLPLGASKGGRQRPRRRRRVRAQPELIHPRRAHALPVWIRRGDLKILWGLGGRHWRWEYSSQVLLFFFPDSLSSR